MTVDEIPGDGAAPQPSAVPTDSAAPDATKVAEDELDAKVRESLGDHYIPLDGGSEEPTATQSEKKGEPKPEETPKPEPEVVGEPSQDEVDLPAIPKPEVRTSRLDKSIAKYYIRNLILNGEQEVPSEEEIIADLRKYPMEDKIQALHYHRLEHKKLKGITPTGNDELDDEDREAIQDAQREQIRSEVLAEENEKKVKGAFVQFITDHPELDETSKTYQPSFARAVETLWRGGMPINEAFDTVSEQITAAKEAFEKETEKSKQAALSGVVSSSGDANPSGEGLTWEDMARLQVEDPTRWEELIKSGYTPKS